MPTNKLALFYLKIGIFSLALAGVYSIILVILRAVKSVYLVDITEHFRAALVVHVNLSVLVWLMSISAIFWSFNLNRLGTYLSTIFSKISLTGAIFIAISPFLADPVPVLNNYIPILQNLWFIIGLSLFGVAMLLQAIVSMISSREKEYSPLIFILVWLCFVRSFFNIQEMVASSVAYDHEWSIEVEYYYELLFWSGGHVLQFLYTHVFMLVWLFFTKILTNNRLRFARIYNYLLYLNIFLAALALIGHVLYDITSFEFREFYTNHMKYAGGIAPVSVMVLTGWEMIFCHAELVLASHEIPKPVRDDTVSTSIKAAMICSAILFLSGGFIGFLISGTDVTIPAHYHGSIVGISLCFMGLAYYICYPNKRVSTAPLYIITIGQIMHIGGLAFAGGYGVLRKAPGLELNFSAKLAMGIMGVGGAIAIIGGLMFVYKCGKKLFLRYD